MANAKEKRWFLFNVSEEQRQLQRQVCSQYAAIGHWTSIAPVLAVLLLIFLQHIYHLRQGSHIVQISNKGTKSSAPSVETPQNNRNRVTRSAVATLWQKLCWWMGDEIYLFGKSLGKRDEWILGVIWFSWLMLLCVVGKSDEPFQLSRLRQDILDIPKKHFLAFPDNEALHLANRFGMVAASQMPILALLRSNIGCLPWCFWWPRLQPHRYYSFLTIATCTLYIVHILVTMSRFQFERLLDVLRIPLWGLFFIYLGVVCTYSLLRRRKSRLMDWTGLVVRISLVLLMVYHAPALRIYFWETLLISIIATGAKTEIRVTRSESFVTTPPPETQASQDALHEQFVWLKRYYDVAGVKSDSSELDSENNGSIETPYTLRLTIQTRWAVFAAFSRFFSVSLSTMGVASGPLVLNKDEILVAQFAAKRAAPRNEILSVSFEGKYNITSGLLHVIARYQTTRILLIGGGPAGYLAYPVYHDICRHNPSANIQLLWVNIPQTDDGLAQNSVLPFEPMQMRQEEISLYAVLTLANDDCDSHLKKTIDDTLQQSLDEDLMVLVLGPEQLTKETRTYLRPWAMRGHKIHLLHHTFKLGALKFGEV
ncbi:uncharacterized protein TRUGW13939_04232 [Talaromyces rugulosus]|uniref:Ferric oxidoreductase domain-containing protein n=1 Tax=Talaromyces rugulosus TaxID=121627 RepID=A0A7H8QT05_TALRU|nr:uncharacterized protein TRUGW13939_04232 [Talaromyces rugulosus]QKX57124.1 hypothetical protein TRUGW13939_04232 [Talaromyces rugulosus]